MKTIQKSKLKEGYYYEYKSFYEALPDTLTVPQYTEKIFSETISNKNILKTYKIKPYTTEEAFAAAADKSQTLRENEYRILYFNDGNTRCRLGVYRSSGGKLGVDVCGVDPDGQWLAGYGVLYSAETLNSLENDSLTLEHFDPSVPTQASAIKYLKDCGYKITRIETITKEVEY